MIYKVSQQKLVLEVAQELKGMIKMPEWANFVKTGSHRETFPTNQDWWYIRAASILRVVSKIGPVGVSKLRVRYGGRKNRGVKPDMFKEASGKVIRVILQQLQESELIKEHKIGNRKGRIATPKGLALLETIAKKILKEKPKAIPKPKAEEKKVEEKTTTEKPKAVEEPKVEKKEEPKPKVEEKKVEEKKVEEKKAVKEEPVTEEKVETEKSEASSQDTVMEAN